MSKSRRNNRRKNRRRTNRRRRGGKLTRGAKAVLTAAALGIPAGLLAYELERKHTTHHRRHKRKKRGGGCGCGSAACTCQNGGGCGLRQNGGGCGLRQNGGGCGLKQLGGRRRRRRRSRRRRSRRRRSRRSHRRSRRTRRSRRRRRRQRGGGQLQQWLYPIIPNDILDVGFSTTNGLKNMYAGYVGQRNVPSSNPMVQPIGKDVKVIGSTPQSDMKAVFSGAPAPPAVGAPAPPSA